MNLFFVSIKCEKVIEIGFDGEKKTANIFQMNMILLIRYIWSTIEYDVNEIINWMYRSVFHWNFKEKINKMKKNGFVDVELFVFQE